MSEPTAPLDEMDCGDNSCVFKSQRGGMRTNGGCRCLQDIEIGREGNALARRIRRAFQSMKAAARRAGIEEAARVCGKCRGLGYLQGIADEDGDRVQWPCSACAPIRALLGAE